MIHKYEEGTNGGEWLLRQRRRIGGKWFERRALFTQSFRIELEWRNMRREIWETKRLQSLPHSMAVFLSLPSRLLYSVRTADANWPLSPCDIQFTVTPPPSHFCFFALLSLNFMWPSSDENPRVLPLLCKLNPTATQKSVNELCDKRQSNSNENKFSEVTGDLSQSGRIGSTS